MSILGNIFSKIFPSSQTAQATPAAPSADAAASAGVASANANNTTAATAAPTATSPMAEVDVESVLNNLASKNPENLNWQSSIVDLMKLLGLDSSLNERKALAKELGYSGDMSDSASMNIWLHREVMNKLAANGGKVPADLKD